jgi:predicted transcriptional regulator
MLMKEESMRIVSTIMIILLTLSSGLAEEVERQSPGYVFWGLLGSYPAEDHLNPYHLTRDDSSVDVASLLYSIRRNFKPIEVIAGETGISRAVIERKLRQLVECDLVLQENEAFIVNFPFFDAPLRDRINELGLEIAGQIAQIVRAEIPKLKELVAVSTLVEQGYSWEDVALIIVGGLLLDTGLNDRGLRNCGVFNQLRDTPLRPGGYRYWYRAVEGGWGPYWKFGQNLMSMEEKNMWFCHFYGQLKGRRMNWDRVCDGFDTKNKAILVPLIQQGCLMVGQIKLPDPFSDSLTTTLQQMLDARVIKVSGDTVYPGFPIFQSEDIKRVLKHVDQVCSHIIDSIYVPFVPKLQREWRVIAPENWKIPNVDKLFVRQVFSRPYNLVLHVLIEEGVLPPAPIEPPFDYYGICGNFEML